MVIETVKGVRRLGLLLTITATLALAGCGEGTATTAGAASDNGSASAAAATTAGTTGSPQASPPPATASVTGSVSPTAAGAPVISGVPPTAARVGVAWSFQPTASDPNGDALSFTVANKPAWMSFETSTGRLSGTPSAGDLGSFGSITITVSDGKQSTSLAPFTVLVSAGTTGSATLSWTPPTSNTDGTALTNLSGYRIYYGTSPSSLPSSVQITNAGLTSYTVANLAPGTYYFAIAAYTTDGVEGDRSTVGSKTIL